VDRGSLTAGDFFAQAGWGGEGRVDSSSRCAIAGAAPFELAEPPLDRRSVDLLRHGVLEEVDRVFVSHSPPANARWRVLVIRRKSLDAALLRLIQETG
jgi:hypothetical protein